MGMPSREQIIQERIAEGNDEQARNCLPLKTAIERLRKRLEARATFLNKRRRTRVDRIHWLARGRQELLCQVANRLQGLCTKYDATNMLYPALNDYLGCLEKYWVDTEEERQTPTANIRWPIQQWRAEGTACELAAVLTDLRRILAEYAPLDEQSLLSLDGTHLVPA